MLCVYITLCVYIMLCIYYAVCVYHVVCVYYVVHCSWFCEHYLVNTTESINTYTLLYKKTMHDFWNIIFTSYICSTSGIENNYT